MSDLLKPVRNSRMALNSVYFWTDTIKDWRHLLKQDKYKTIIIDTWKQFVERELIIMYGFVIMPNHIHVIWELIKMNGKEMPHASFNKRTAHIITKDLQNNHPNVLKYFISDDKERSYRIWQRDPLAILMDSKSKLEQKLDYLHNNPLQEKWNLTTSPELYEWSSAGFYDNCLDNYGFLTHYNDRF